MLKETNLSEPQAQEAIRARLRKFFEDTQFPQAQAAASMNVSSSVLSSWMRGTYKGDSEKVAAAIASYLRQQAAKRGVVARPVQYAETSVAINVIEIAEICQLEHKFGVAYGSSGIGKTMAVRKYADENPNVILIEAIRGMSPTLFFRELNAALRLSATGNVNSLFFTARNALKGTDRMIIVDESEYLGEDILDRLRRLQDFTGIGLLLVGLPSMIEKMKRRDGLEYLRTRIKAPRKLTPLMEMDVEAIIDANYPEYTEFVPEFFQASKGIARTLDTLLDLVHRMVAVNGEKPSKAAIERASRAILMEV